MNFKKTSYLLIAVFAGLYLPACESSGPTQTTSVNHVLAAYSFVRESSGNVSRPTYSGYVVDVTLVSDFYDVGSGDRIYSVESSTAVGGTTYDIVKADSKALVKRLKQDKIIR